MGIGLLVSGAMPQVSLAGLPAAQACGAWLVAP
jgi:hypothetical protein